MAEPAFFDTSWLAVPGLVDTSLLAALGLTDGREVSWAQGLSAVLGDYWDPEADVDASLSRVFVVPVHGRPQGSVTLAVEQERCRWTLFLGGWFGDDGEQTRVPDACVAASRLRGAAHAFTAQNRLDWYAWTAASNGRLQRRIVWSGRATVNEGTPAVEENWDARDAFHEETIGRLASSYAAGPNELAGATPGGLLVVTGSGRAHGVPARPLDE